MALGGCFCGKIRIEYDGEPISVGLCHCSHCRKLTGSLFTYNFVIKTADLEITGTPKTLSKTSDSGTRVVQHFCQDCGTPLFSISSAKALDGVTILRAGVFDDLEVLNQQEPRVEVFVGGRVKWMSPRENTEQCVAMPPSMSDEPSS